MQVQRFKLLTLASPFPESSSFLLSSWASLEFSLSSLLSSSFLTGKSSCGSSHGQSGHEEKVMIKRNSSITTSSSSNTDGSESTSCKKMKSNSGNSGEKEGIEGEESSSSERSVTRNGNIESTEKLLLDVSDEVMMMKKTSSSSSPPSSPRSTITPSSLPSAPLSSPSSHSLSSSQSNKKKSKNHSTESNRSNIMTTSPGISSKEVERGEHLIPEEERHSLREGEEKHSMKEEGKVTEFTSSSHSPVGWHPHVYHQTPKKFTAFSILDILSRDPSSSPSPSSFLPTESSTNNKNNMDNKNLEKRDLTCNNKLNPNQRSSIISASFSHNASQSALHSSPPPILLPPPSVVPSSSSSLLSSSPLLLHQLHRNKSTEAEALISNHSTSSPILPLSSPFAAKDRSSSTDHHSSSRRGSNTACREKTNQEEQGDHYQVRHSSSSFSVF